VIFLHWRIPAKKSFGQLRRPIFFTTGNINLAHFFHGSQKKLSGKRS
jgi:hypothetical protein